MSSPPSASASPSSKPAPLSPGETQSEHEEGEQSPEPSTSKADSEKAEEENSNSSAPSTSVAPSGTSATASAGDWQAIWSPAHNAYYFYNSVTQETTWANPLEQAATAGANQAGSAEPEGKAAVPSTSTSATISQLYALQEAAAAQGIDPSLAYLDPSLAAGPSTNPAAYSYTAKFNARTGAFARPDARDPTHLSEYERMKRMNEVFFDQAQWEAQLEEETEAGSKKRKKPTKKDLERFKEQKRQKKIAKTAWLRT